MAETQNNKQVRRDYGDENLRYPFLARDMSPMQAREYFEQSFTDCIAMQMPLERLNAVWLRGQELV